jgi:hypothetical protein
MVDRLYHRGQDPDDKGVDASFIWRTWADIPAANIYNMDEVGCDTNKERKKKVQLHDDPRRWCDPYPALHWPCQPGHQV